MRRLFCLVCVIFALIVSSGCGKSDSASTNASDPSKPIEGSAASKSTQFVGTWMAITEGEFLGFEFMKDGKVLVTNFAAMGLGSGAGQMTMTYSLLDGGRLSLVAPTGQTMVYQTTMSGDVLELKGNFAMQGEGMQRFQRLKAGQTLEQGIKERADADSKAYVERTKSVEAFFKQKGLVLIYGSGTGANVAVDADTTFAGGFNGKAWHDGPSPHLDQISAQLNQDQRNNKLSLRINFGPEILPSPGGQGAGNATLDITGNGSDMKVAGKVQYGNSGTPMDLVLKVDQKMHDEIVKKFDAEMAKLEEQKKPLIEALEDYAVISGTAGNPGGQPSQDRIILVSTDKPGIWRGEGSVYTPANRTTAPIAGPMAAIIELDNNKKPMLVIKSPLREYQLTVSSAGGNKLEGGWFYPGNPQGQRVDFAIADVYDKATRAKMVEAQKAALSSLGGSAPYIGTYISRNNGGYSPYIPFILTLTGGANGAVNGSAKFPMQAAALDVKGQIVDALEGPQMQLTFNYAGQDRNSQTMFNQFRQPMVLGIGQNADGMFTLNARSQATGDFALTRFDDAQRAKNKQMLTDALAKGIKFRSVFPYPDQPQATILDMKIDPATGKISGTVPQARPNIFQTNSTIEGELKDEDGVLILATEITDPKVGTRFQAKYITNLYMHLSDKGWIGVAIYYPSHSTGARQPLDILELKN